MQRIIETASDLFGEFGYNDVRMEDIATRAGVAKGTLYLYYKDKDDLFLALILERMDQLFAQVQARAQGVEQPEEKLLVVVQEAFDYFRSYPHIFAAIQRLDNVGSVCQMEALRGSRTRFLNFSASIIRELNATGRAAVKDPDIAAVVMCGMMRELLFAPPPSGGEDFPEQIVDMFLHGIVKAKA
ncbi:MAG: TetR/AcrR family transcriptional regulator [Planctomycetota bacterium]